MRLKTFKFGIHPKDMKELSHDCKFEEMWDDMGVPELRAEMEQLCKYSFHSTKELEKLQFTEDRQ